MDGLAAQSHFHRLQRDVNRKPLRDHGAPSRRASITERSRSASKSRRTWIWRAHPHRNRGLGLPTGQHAHERRSGEGAPARPLRPPASRRRSVPHPLVGRRQRHTQSRRRLSHRRLSSGHQLDQVRPLLLRVSSAHPPIVPSRFTRRYVRSVQRLRIISQKLRLSYSSSGARTTRSDWWIALKLWRL